MLFRSAYCATVGDSMGTDENPLTVEPMVVSDNEDDDGPALPPRRRWEFDKQSSRGSNSITPDGLHWVEWNEPTPKQDGLNNLPNQPVVIEDEEDRLPDNKAAKFLHIHHKFNHLPFAKLKEMARAGVIDKSFKDMPTPVCSACAFAKMKKRQWKQKSQTNWKEPRKPTQPGEVVSVDQMKSDTKGFVAQMTGRLTTSRYEYATVFVDQFSRLGYVHLQKTPTAEETLEGKRAFEQ